MDYVDVLICNYCKLFHFKAILPKSFTVLHNYYNIHLRLNVSFVVFAQIRILLNVFSMYGWCVRMCVHTLLLLFSTLVASVPAFFHSSNQPVI